MSLKFVRIFSSLVIAMALAWPSFPVLATNSSDLNAATRWIRVTSPNGGEVVTVGDVYRITWQASANIDKVSIGYKSCYSCLTWIVTNIPNTGYYDWTVSVGNTSITKFTIQITGYQSGVGSDTDYSDSYFTVLPKPTPTRTPTKTATATRTRTPTRTATSSKTPWPSKTPTSSKTPTPTDTPTDTPTPVLLPLGDGIGLIGEYFDNTMVMNGAPLSTRLDPQVKFYWDDESPVPGVIPNDFSVRWVGQIEARSSEDYSFAMNADDIVRMWIDGQIYIDDWDNPVSFPVRIGPPISLVRGQKYDIQIDFRDTGGGASAEFYWHTLSGSIDWETVPTEQLYPSAGGLSATATSTPTATFTPTPTPILLPPGNGSGLIGEYFDNAMDLNGAPLYSRLDPQVNFSWGDNSPLPDVIPNDFSARWFGQLEARSSEDYSLAMVADDNVRMWIDGQIYIDDWDNPPVDFVRIGTPISLVRGQKYDIQIDVRDTGGGATAEFWWTTLSGSIDWEIVPSEQLYPSTGGLPATATPTPTDTPSPTDTPTESPTITNTATATLGRWMKVISPNGGEVLGLGETYRIKWDSSPDIESVWIMLKDCPSCGNWIATSLPNNGYFDWTVSIGSPLITRQFTIMVFGYKLGVGFITDESDSAFTVICPPTPTATPVPWISLIAPNGGEVLTVGDTYRIMWDSSPEINSVSIRLLPCPSCGNGFLFNSLPNTGYVDWDVWNGNSAGNQFRIEIQGYSSTGGSPKDQSDSTFTILPKPTSTPTETHTSSPTSTIDPIITLTIPPTPRPTPEWPLPITIIKPVAGEILTYGEISQIVWEVSSEMPYVYMELVSRCKGCAESNWEQEIDWGLSSNNSGEMQWVVLVDEPLDTEYAVHIEGRGADGISVTGEGFTGPFFVAYDVMPIETIITFPTPIATITPTPTLTPTPTDIATPTPTATPTVTATPTSTPIITDTLAPTAVPAMTVIINELAWAGTKYTSSGEWIELYNPSSQPIDLAGWRLISSDNSPDILLTGTIPAAGYYLLERDNDSTVSDIAADQIYTGDLSYNGETLRLYSPSGNLVDTANLDGGGWNGGTGSPTFGSMERRLGFPDGPFSWITNIGVVRNGLDGGGNPINGTPKYANWANNVTPTPSRTPTLTVTPSSTWTVTNTRTPRPPTDTPPPTDTLSP